MQTVKTFIYGPTPEEQKRKCNSLIRSNARKIDRDIASLKQLEAKSKSYIVAANKRAQKSPSQKTQALKETRIFARELVRVRRQTARLTTSRAQLESVRMQVNEAFSVRKIESTLKNSTVIMKEVNTLIKIPELTGTMTELARELAKAGIIEEMIDDSLPADPLEEDEEAEEEVEKVLGEVLKDRLPSTAEQAPLEGTPVEAEPVEEEEDENQEELLEQMRGRLEALKS